MFTALPTFAGRRPTERKPVCLGLQPLEPRDVPSSTFSEHKVINVKEGTAYQDVVVLRYTPKDRTTANDYFIGSLGFSTGPVLLEQDGAAIVARTSVAATDEGTFHSFFNLARKSDFETIWSSEVTLHSYNAPVTVTDTKLLLGVHNQNSGRQLLATFFDTRPAAAAVGRFEAVINWGDRQTSDGEMVVSGDNVEVYGSHTYQNPGNFALHDISVTLRESNGGQWKPGSPFCTATHEIIAVDGMPVSVGGQATAHTFALTASAAWVNLFGNYASQVAEAVDSAWTEFTGTSKGIGLLWQKLGSDAIANQGTIVQTVLKVLHGRASDALGGLLMNVLPGYQAGASGSDSFGQAALSGGVAQLMLLVQNNLAGIPVALAGISGVSPGAGLGGLDAGVAAAAERLAASLNTRSLLKMYVNCRAADVNPGTRADNTATLTAANLDAVLKGVAVVPAVPPADAPADQWQTLATIMSQRLQRTASFGDPTRGSDLKIVLAGLKDGSTGILHGAPTASRPAGTLIGFLKLDGKVLLFDPQTGRPTAVVAGLDYQFLNTTP
jgi:hypothetical protein